MKYARVSGVLWTVSLLTVYPCIGSAQQLVFQDVSVIDVVAGQVRPAQNVVVDGDRIVSVGKAAPPANAKRIDGKGRFLMPGLWEMHGHLNEPDELFYLFDAAGITGLRDLGSTLSQTRGWQGDVAEGRLIGPRLITSGSDLDPPNGRPYPGLPVIKVSTAAEGRAAVDQLRAMGVDFVKPLNISREAYFGAAARARELGMVFAGHVTPVVSVREAIDAGQRTIEHMFSFPVACSSKEKEILAARVAASNAEAPEPKESLDELVGSFDAQKCRSLLRTLRDHHVWVTPTLASPAIYADIQSGVAQKYPAVSYLPERIQREWVARTSDVKPATAEELAERANYTRLTWRIVKMMQDTGVGLLAGTDSGDPYDIQGFSLHQELQLLVKAGLTPAQALRTATLEPAKLLHKEATLGTIETGKEADLVLLTANPLQDIGNTSKIDAVMVRGLLLDREQLDRMLREKSASRQALSK